MLQHDIPQSSQQNLDFTDFPDGITEFATQIADMCKGLPLSLVLIAGVLLHDPGRRELWEKVSHHVHDQHLSRVGSDTSRLLELTYRHLPDKLKPCFLYLGLFPEDYEIPVWKLVRLWISEGFIDGEESPNLKLENIAEQYLEELVQRSLVMVADRRSNGKIKTCRLHDVLRDFCMEEANKENFFQEITSHNLNLNSSGHPSLDKCHRICINDPSIKTLNVSGKRVRSFLTFQTESKHLVSSIPKTFKLLKVLEAHSLSSTLRPVDLKHLVLLKYISISSNFSTIPSVLSGLQNLQTLIVSTTSKTLKVDMDLWKMPHFRHFHTKSSASLPSPDTKSPKREETLVKTSVQTLSTISPECCSQQVFDRTPGLKKLGIHGDLAMLFDSAGESGVRSIFGVLHSLENLKLINSKANIKLPSLSSHACFPPWLKMLTLTNTRLDWKEMSTLGWLKKLEVLKLKEFAFQGAKWITEEGGFVRLVHLHIGRTDLVWWDMEASDGTFPELKTLKLHYCDKLEALPVGLEEIPSLQSLDLHCTNPELASSAIELQELKYELEGTNSLRLSIYPPAPGH